MTIFKLSYHSGIWRWWKVYCTYTVILKCYLKTLCHSKTVIEALCDFGPHLLKAYVFKSFDLLSLCDFGPHLLEACVFESFDFVYSPVTCFDGRRENWALGVWSSPVMIVWMISRTKVIMWFRKYRLGFGFIKPTGMRPAPRHSIPCEDDCEVIM